MGLAESGSQEEEEVGAVVVVVDEGTAAEVEAMVVVVVVVVVGEKAVEEEEEEEEEEEGEGEVREKVKAAVDKAEIESTVHLSRVIFRPLRRQLRRLLLLVFLACSSAIIPFRLPPPHSGCPR